VTLERATVVADRLYILLFVSDEEDGSTLEGLSTDLAPERTPADQDAPDPSPRGDGETPSTIGPVSAAPPPGFIL